MVVSQNEELQYRPSNTIVLVMGTPKKVFLILGKPHVGIHTVGIKICGSGASWRVRWAITWKMTYAGIKGLGCKGLECRIATP